MQTTSPSTKESSSVMRKVLKAKRVFGTETQKQRTNTDYKIPKERPVLKEEASSFEGSSILGSDSYSGAGSSPLSRARRRVVSCVKSKKHIVNDTVLDDDNSSIGNGIETSINDEALETNRNNKNNRVNHKISNVSPSEASKSNATISHCNADEKDPDSLSLDTKYYSKKSDEKHETGRGDTNSNLVPKSNSDDGRNAGAAIVYSRARDTCGESCSNGRYLEKGIQQETEEIKPSGNVDHHRDDLISIGTSGENNRGSDYSFEKRVNLAEKETKERSLSKIGEETRLEYDHGTYNHRRSSKDAKRNEEQQEVCTCAQHPNHLGGDTVLLLTQYEKAIQQRIIVEQQLHEQRESFARQLQQYESQCIQKVHGKEYEVNELTGKFQLEIGRMHEEGQSLREQLLHLQEANQAIQYRTLEQERVMEEFKRQQRSSCEYLWRLVIELEVELQQMRLSVGQLPLRNYINDRPAFPDLNADEAFSNELSKLKAELQSWGQGHMQVLKEKDQLSQVKTKLERERDSLVGERLDQLETQALQRLLDQLKESTRRLEREIEHRSKANEGHDDMNLCVVCMTAKVDIVIVPCGHMSLCDRCSRDSRLRHCPMCRKDIQLLQKVFS